MTKIQYQIMELDSEHLKKADRMWDGLQDRVCFRPAKLEGFDSNIQDSMEEAIDVIKRSGNDYTEYTIIPRIYMTDFED